MHTVTIVADLLKAPVLEVCSTAGKPQRRERDYANSSTLAKVAKDLFLSRIFLRGTASFDVVSHKGIRL